MKLFTYFRGKWGKKQADMVKAEFDELNDTAAKARLDENMVQAPIKIYEEGFLDESTNSNLLREILPIITRGNNLLRTHKNLMEDRDKVASEVTMLLGKINEVAAKKRDLEKAFQKIESADLNTLRSYCLFNDEESGDIILMSNAVNSKNMIMTAPQYPAVITVHTLTNEVMTYDTFDELAGSGDYPLKRSELDKKISKMTVNACSGMESIEEMKQIAFTMLEEAAVKIQALYDEKNAKLGTLLEEQTLSPYDQARILAETLPNEEGLSVSFRKLTNCVMIQNRNNYSTLTLWYSEEGITGAYFSNSAGMAQRVYDVREFHKGFLNLDPQYQDEYQKLLSSNALKKFLAIENMELSTSKEKAPVYWIGQTEHTPNEVIKNREPEYPGSSNERDLEWTSENRMNDWKGRLTSIMHKYQEVINTARISNAEEESFSDIILDYNVYNHSVGLTRGDERVVVQYSDNLNINKIYIKNISDRLLKKGNKVVANETFRYSHKDAYYIGSIDYTSAQIEKPKFYDSIAKELGLPPFYNNTVYRTAMGEPQKQSVAAPVVATPPTPTEKKPDLIKKSTLPPKKEEAVCPPPKELKGNEPKKKLLPKKELQR